MCWPLTHKWFESDRIWMWHNARWAKLVPFQHEHSGVDTAVTLVTYHCQRCRVVPKQHMLKGHLPGGAPDEARSKDTWHRLPKE